jgi:hypothetical protein
MSSEGSEIDYTCLRFDSFLIHNSDKTRNCIKGKWTGSVPKCGKYKTIKLKKILIKISSHSSIKALDVGESLLVKTREINYLDRNSSTEIYPMDEALIETPCFHFDKTKNLKLKLNYSSPKRISALKFNFYNLLNYHQNKDMSINILINANRICIIDELHSDSNSKRSFLKIVCELKSFEDYKNESFIEQSLQLTFKSEYFFKLEICNIFVYQFQDDCGFPDIPLHSTIEKVNKTVKFYPNSGYRLIGDNTINCLFEGNWDKEPPILEPIIQCNTEDIDLNSSIYKSIKFQKLEFFNGTEVAVIGTEILFECNDEKNSSEILVSFCGGNGSWIGSDYKCK